MQRFLLPLMFSGLIACQSTPDPSISDPEPPLAAEVLERGGQLFYTLRAGDGRTYVDTSRLGIILEDRRFTDELRITGSQQGSGVSEYALLTGKQRKIAKPYSETRYTVANAAGQTMYIDLRQYADGIGFRYVFPDSNLTVVSELSEFRLPAALTAWRQPNDEITTYSPAYERYFNKSKTDEPMERGTSIVFPLLAYDADRAILLHESAPEGQYFGANLTQRGSSYRINTPRPAEANGLHLTTARLGAPPRTPWRIVVAGESLDAILATTLPTDFSPPRRTEVTDWIRPGRAAWSWWSDNDSPQDYAKQVRFVDFAAEQGWAYSLVDANWNVMRGGSLAQLAAYARDKGVGLLVWYNSGGPHNDVPEMPRDRMLDPAVRRTEMKKLQDLGVAGIKVDFFQSDKQAIMNQYLGILEDAANHELLVNFHGCTVPRGWRRAYPHLMTMEAVSGAECYIFREDYENRAPVQNTVLPFTRNAVGPMDFTPVTFTQLKYPRKTTDAHELALAVIFESGIQHFADDVAAYRALPEKARNYLAEVPVVWDEIRLVEAVPGEYVVLARRHGDRWYVAGVNGTGQPRSVVLASTDFGALSTQIGDDAAGDLSLVGGSLPDTLRMAPYGGFVRF